MLQTCASYNHQRSAAPDSDDCSPRYRCGSGRPVHQFSRSIQLTANRAFLVMACLNRREHDSTGGVGVFSTGRVREKRYTSQLDNIVGSQYALT